MDPREKWQNEAEAIWNLNGGNGIVEAGTGTGKTFLALKIIIKALKHYSTWDIDIVVPRVPLKAQWEKHLKAHGLDHIEVFVINTYVKEKRDCDLRILDEIHNYAATSYKKVFGMPYKHLLGLTATLERKDGLHLGVITRHPVLYRLPIKEARKLGFVSDYQVFNLGVDFDKESKNKYAEPHRKFKWLFSRFDNDFHHAMNCVKGSTTHLNLRARATKESVKDVRGMAMAWLKLMKKRKTLIHNAEAKIPVVEELVSSLKGKTLIFTQTIDFCDKIAEAYGS